jgi:hypothetical protein
MTASANTNGFDADLISDIFGNCRSGFDAADQARHFGLGLVD